MTASKYTEIDGMVIMVDDCVDCPFWEPSHIASWEGSYDGCRHPARSKVITDNDRGRRRRTNLIDDPRFTCPLNEMILSEREPVELRFAWQKDDEVNVQPNIYLFSSDTIQDVIDFARQCDNPPDWVEIAITQDKE